MRCEEAAPFWSKTEIERRRRYDEIVSRALVSVAEKDKLKRFPELERRLAAAESKLKQYADKYGEL